MASLLAAIGLALLVPIFVVFLPLALIWRLVLDTVWRADSPGPSRPRILIRDGSSSRSNSRLGKFSGRSSRADAPRPGRLATPLSCGPCR
jgi:hypothetical protein